MATLVCRIAWELAETTAHYRTHHPPSPHAFNLSCVMQLRLLKTRRPNHVFKWTLALARYTSTVRQIRLYTRHFATIRCQSTVIYIRLRFPRFSVFFVATLD